MVMMGRGDEPPPTLGSLFFTIPFSLLLSWSDEKLSTLVCSWHLAWAATVTLTLLFYSVSAVLVIAVSILVVMAVVILWDQLRGGPRGQAADKGAR